MNVLVAILWVVVAAYVFGALGWALAKLRASKAAPAPAPCIDGSVPRFVFRPRPGCACLLCAGITARPDLQLTASTIANVQAAMILVGTAKMPMVAQEFEHLGPDGVSGTAVVVLDGALFRSVVLPVLHAKLAQGGGQP